VIALRRQTLRDFPDAGAGAEPVVAPTPERLLALHHRERFQLEITS
jgi:hypothetical protein